jgi:hypothetical protein
MAISLIPFDRLIFGLCAAPKMAPRLVHQFWGSHSDAVSQLLVREVIVAEQVEVLPGNRRAMGHRQSSEGEPERMRFAGSADSIGRTY